MEGIETSMSAVNGLSGAGEGLMSPLLLGGDSPNMTSGSFQFSQAPSVRSPTPEPEDTTEDPDPSAPDSALNINTISTHDSDPAHQPYLGRVDELDTGPLPTTPTMNGHSQINSEGEGSGEGGNMTPHGMSERPIPLSSTTTPTSSVTDEEGRRIAAIPRGTPRRPAELGSLGDRFVSGGEVMEGETKQE
jgi:hypothetical protein